MSAGLAISYGLSVYMLFLAAFTYFVGFVGNFVVPKSIDSGEPSSLLLSIVVNIALLALFAVQHSVMARAGFKRMWTRIIPKRVERSTYVLLSTVALTMICAFWQPMPESVWSLEGSAATASQLIFWLGWAIVLTSTYLINHFELFGLQQVLAAVRGKALVTTTFRTPLFYRYVRHPLYFGFLLAFWATPTMSVGHLLFAIGFTGYILLGIALEERDLIASFGEPYRRYRAQVGMLIPWRARTPAPAQEKSWRPSQPEAPRA